MLNLLVKDFKLLLFSDKASLKKKILSALFTTIMLGIFISFEVYLFTMIINNVKRYPYASQAFLTLFIFIISCIMIIFNISRANKLFFNEKDIEQLTRYPVTNGEIISSKLVFLFAMHYVTSLVFTYPIFIAYGRILGRSALYYFTCLFYPVLSFLFEAGVALIICYPIKLLLDYMKKHIVLQFVSSIAIMSALCYLYSIVLKLFMNLVVTNSLGSLFTTSFIQSLITINKYFVPINLLVETTLGVNNYMITYLCIGLGVLILGVSVSIFAFSYFRSIRFTSKPKKLKKKLKVKGQNIILIKKELILLFKDSNNIFTYTGLLIIQPFLMYLVISALNGVFSSGVFQYYIIAMPQFVPLLDIVMMMIFTVIVNSGANGYIQNENKTLKIMKTIPINYKRQLLIKVLVPFSASVISLFASGLVLVLVKSISPLTLCFGIILSILLLIVFDLVSLKEELSIRMNKPKSSFVSSIYSYLLPILFFVVAFLTSNVGVPIILSYFIGIVVILLLGLPYLIILIRKSNSLFMELEASN